MDHRRPTDQNKQENRHKRPRDKRLRCPFLNMDTFSGMFSFVPSCIRASGSSDARLLLTPRLLIVDALNLAHRHQERIEIVDGLKNKVKSLKEAVDLRKDREIKEEARIASAYTSVKSTVAG